MGVVSTSPIVNEPASKKLPIDLKSYIKLKKERAHKKLF
jgi:hypothetical protein